MLYNTQIHSLYLSIERPDTKWETKEESPDRCQYPSSRIIIPVRGIRATAMVNSPQRGLAVLL